MMVGLKILKIYRCFKIDVYEVDFINRYYYVYDKLIMYA